MTMYSDRGKGQMIDFLNGLWPGWKGRLWKMPYNQVFAIYKKEQKRVAEAARKLEREQYIARVLALQHHTTGYDCDACGNTFEADNHELRECRFCGSQKIRRNDYD